MGRQEAFALEGDELRSAELVLGSIGDADGLTLDPEQEGFGVDHGQIVAHVRSGCVA